MGVGGDNDDVVSLTGKTVAQEKEELALNATSRIIVQTKGKTLRQACDYLGIVLQASNFEKYWMEYLALGVAVETLGSALMINEIHSTIAAGDKYVDAGIVAPLALIIITLLIMVVFLFQLTGKTWAIVGGVTILSIGGCLIAGCATLDTSDYASDFKIDFTHASGAWFGSALILMGILLIMTLTYTVRRDGGGPRRWTAAVAIFGSVALIVAGSVSTDALIQICDSSRTVETAEILPNIIWIYVSSIMSLALLMYVLVGHNGFKKGYLMQGVGVAVGVAMGAVFSTGVLAMQLKWDCVTESGTMSWGYFLFIAAGVLALIAISLVGANRKCGGAHNHDYAI